VIAARTLPRPATPLIGRRSEVAAAQEAVSSPSARLITITGPPGVGKTRLALAAAAGIADGFAGGVVWMDLTALRDADLVLPEIRAAIDIERSGGLDRDAVLLLLDNCERRRTSAAPGRRRLPRTRRRWYRSFAWWSSPGHGFIRPRSPRRTVSPCRATCRTSSGTSWPATSPSCRVASPRPWSSPAQRRPFLYVPLRHHFEQNFHVRHRLDRYGAGRCVDYAEAADPERLAATMTAELGRTVTYREVETDGAARAAGRIAELL
jgi:hypothetical protein